MQAYSRSHADILRLQQYLADVFVHAIGRAGLVAAHVFQAEHLEQSLDSAVLAVGAVQHGECQVYGEFLSGAQFPEAHHLAIAAEKAYLAVVCQADPLRVLALQQEVGRVAEVIPDTFFIYAHHEDFIVLAVYGLIDTPG